MEFPQLFDSSCHVAIWWWRKPRQTLYICLTESRHIQHHRHEIGIHDLRLPLLLHTLLGDIGPQPEADTRGQTPRSSRSLSCHVHADAHSLEMAQVVGGIKDEFSVVAAVHHDSDTLYCQRCLSNRRGQHHLSLSLCRGTDRLVLLLWRQIAIKQAHMGRAQTIAQQFRTFGDISLPGEESQYIAFHLAVYSADSGGNSLCYFTRKNIVFREHSLHGIHPPLTGDFAGAKGLTNSCGVDGSRHHDDVQVRSEDTPRLLCQTESQIRLQAALMKLVEDDAAHAFERRVFDQAAREDSLCDHLYPCLQRNLLLEAYLIAYRLPHFLAEHLCHAQGYLPGSQAAGLKHDDSALCTTAEHRQRQQRGLTGTRWSYDHGGMALQELCIELFSYSGCWQLVVFLDDIHDWHRL